MCPGKYLKTRLSRTLGRHSFSLTIHEVSGNRRLIAILRTSVYFSSVSKFSWNLVLRGFPIELFELDVKIVKFKWLIEYADPKFRKLS